MLTLAMITTLPWLPNYFYLQIKSYRTPFQTQVHTVQTLLSNKFYYVQAPGHLILLRRCAWRHREKNNYESSDSFVCWSVTDSICRYLTFYHQYQSHRIICQNNMFMSIDDLKVVDPISFGFFHRNGVLGIRWKLLFHYPHAVKYDMQQMLILIVTSENVAKVQKLL